MMEVQIYRDSRNYSPKIVMGMTGRQLICVAVAVIVGGSGYALCWWLGLHDVGDYWLLAVSGVCAVVGWARPKGLSIEAYGAYVLAHERQPAHVTYRQTVVPPDVTQGKSTTKKGEVNEVGR